MLREVIDDALARGERLKRDIVEQILKSATLNELINNKRFADSIARIIQTKDEIGRVLRQNVQEALRVMSIPSKQQITSYEKRVDHLERKIDSIGRRLMKKKLHGNSSSRHKSR